MLLALLLKYATRVSVGRFYWWGPGALVAVGAPSALTELPGPAQPPQHPGHGPGTPLQLSTGASVPARAAMEVCAAPALLLNCLLDFHSGPRTRCVTYCSPVARWSVTKTCCCHCSAHRAVVPWDCTLVLSTLVLWSHSSRPAGRQLTAPDN